jgi:hypothetical protein
VVATAQDNFKGMLRECVSPALRAEGFKGSAGIYYLPSDSHWVGIGFQRHQVVCTAQRIKFTINLKVISRTAWEQARQEAMGSFSEHSLPEKPSPNVCDEGWWRIGKVMPDRLDRWWWLRADEDFHPVAEEVVSALRTWGFPSLKAELRVLV